MIANNNGKPAEYVWIIAGGILQIPLILEAQSRGYKVLVSDRDPDAPGCEIADQVVIVDTYDVNGHREIAGNMSRKPVAVLTAGADVGPTVSAVAEMLGLPAEKYKTAVKCRNKLELRRTLKLPHPVYMEIDATPSTPHILWKMRCRSADIDPYPCIVKPLQHSGSKGLSVVYSPFEWPKALKTALSVGTRYNPVRTVIVEEMMHGSEFATDSFIYDDKVYIVNASCRMFHNNEGLEAGHINPWQPPEEVKELIRYTAAQLGMTFGPLKVDFIFDARFGWTILEAATRLSGGFDHMVTAPLATGKDITGAMLDLALGKGLTKTKIRAKRKEYACAYAPILDAGKVDKWVVPIDQTENVYILAKDEIVKPANCAARPVFVIAVGKTPLGAYKRAVRLGRSIKVKYANDPQPEIA